MRVRREKRDRLLEPRAGAVPGQRSRAPRRWPRSGPRYGDLPTDTATGDKVAVTGRVIFIRNTGKLCFATLRDGDGTELQAMLSLDRVGAEALEDWKRLVDLGDHVGVDRRGDHQPARRAVRARRRWAMTAKALRPLPVAHKPMTEEARVRQRYVDLDRAAAGAGHGSRPAPTVVRSLRDTLHERDFIEVETPMLQLLHGGAAARPFVTHSNALDTDLYLRIAPELFLKRCVVGGIERVFEINRNFRNEGIDSSHSPEFAMLEAYQAYGDYNDDGDADPRAGAGGGACGSSVPHVVTHADGTRVRPRRRSGADVTLYGALSEALGEEVTVETPHGHAWRSTPTSTTSASTRSGGRASWPRSCSRSSSCAQPVAADVRA